MALDNRHSRYYRREQTAAWLMTAPALAGVVLFLLAPFLGSLFFSFTDFRLGSPLARSFVGLEQYRRIFADPAFGRALANNAIFACVTVPLQTACALALALLLDRPLKGIKVFRAFFFVPVIFPMALVAVVWELIYAPGPQGLFNALLHHASFGAWQPRDFLHDPHLALAALVLLSMWQGVGFQMVILLAGLQSIDPHLLEAARMDGAGPWQRFRHVILPQLTNTLVFVALMTTILAFRLFDQVWILTQGGPRGATTTVIFEMVRAVFQRQDVARGAAMAVAFFIIVMAITLVQRLVLKQRREIE